MGTSVHLCALLILDSEGGRICVRYAGEMKGNFEQQRKMEIELVQRVHKIVGRNEAEAFEFEDYIVVFESLGDVCVFALAKRSCANELVLLKVVEAISSSLSSITNREVQRKQLMDSLASVFLVLDEVMDEGLLLEADPAVILARANMTDVVECGQPEQTAFNLAISNAKENLMKSLLSGTS